jgi:hypothetical protein
MEHALLILQPQCPPATFWVFVVMLPHCRGFFP